MTKWGIVVILVVAVMLSSAAFYFANLISHADTGLTVYTARKDDLLLSQQKIAQDIASLNQTLQTEIDTQKTLTDKISQLSAQANLPLPVINTTRIVQSAPVYVPVAAQAAPVSMPVTRAS